MEISWKGVIKNLIVDIPIATTAALSQFDPTYAAIWAFTTTFLNQMTKDEREIFIEELFKQEVKEEFFGSVEFARASKATIEAAANTASEEKIRMLARLLRVGTNKGLINDFDVYKEFAKLIDDISPREFSILLILEEITTRYLRTNNADKQRLWNEVEENAKKELGIPSETLQGLMSRLI